MFAFDLRSCKLKRDIFPIALNDVTADNPLLTLQQEASSMDTPLLLVGPADDCCMCY